MDTITLSIAAMFVTPRVSSQSKISRAGHGEARRLQGLRTLAVRIQRTIGGFLTVGGDEGGFRQVIMGASRLIVTGTF
jgi:hypothetical protein